MWSRERGASFSAADAYRYIKSGICSPREDGESTQSMKVSGWA